MSFSLTDPRHARASVGTAFTPSLGEEIAGTLSVAPKLKNKLGPVLSAGRVRAWLWGHEHRCVGFKALNLKPSGISIAYPRCIGHGGMHMPPYTADDPPARGQLPRARDRAR